VKYPERKPLVKSDGISESTITAFMNTMSARDGILYTSFTLLNFSRPAVCLTGEHGEQKTVTIDNIKAIMREERHG
jgi:hypothetical protein